MVELTKKHFLVYGFLLVMIGIEVRMIDTITLNQQVTHFIASHSSESANSTMASIFTSSAMPHKSVRPPLWLGLAMISLGTVSLLHAVPMKG